MNSLENMQRRKFLQFMGRSGQLVGMAALLPTFLQGCTTGQGLGKPVTGLPFTPLLPHSSDNLELAAGFSFLPLITWDTPLNATEKFGFNNDYLALLPFSEGSTDQAYLWVNHEAADPQFVSGHAYYDPNSVKTKAQAELEMRSMGGSLLHVRKDEKGNWQLAKNSGVHRRFDALTEIPFSGGHKIRGSAKAIGTLANCSGGVTPWKTFLSCEENYQNYYGEVSFDDKGNRTVKPPKPTLALSPFYDHPPEHYGWVVEINPVTRQAVKHISLGRFAHEGATCVTASDGRCVVYMGDDKADECFYKFISAKPGSLSEGTLYVANLEKGQWMPLDLKQSPQLRNHFKTQTDVLIRSREAAKILGGTPLDRPEDCEVDPVTKSIILACTNNPKAGRPYGSLMRFEEENQDHLSLKFKSQTWIAGGEASGFACPDNLCFDPSGNLWVTTDISGKFMNKDEYAFHGNNSLFVIPMKGPQAGKAFRVASAPFDAEFTGPCFSPDGKTLFIAVQHPGETSKGPANLTSHWPDGGNAIPRPTVVTVQGPALQALLQS